MVFRKIKTLNAPSAKHGIDDGASPPRWRLVILCIVSITWCGLAWEFPAWRPIESFFLRPAKVSIKKGVDGHRWVIDGQTSYFQRGVVYQPTEGFQHIYDYYYKNRKLGFLYAQILSPRDATEIHPSFKGRGHGEEMQRAGLNAIRVYHLPVEDNSEVEQVKAIFRKSYLRYGIRVLVGDWIGLYDHPNDDRLNARRLEKLVLLYSDEPWLLAWQIGNENNFYVEGGTLGNAITKSATDYYSHMDFLAGIVRAAERRRRGRHPVFLGQGDLKANELLEISKLRHFDGIGLNLFTSRARIQWIFDEIRSSTSLSIIISEVGLPAEAGILIGEQQQANGLREQLSVINNNQAGGEKGNNAIGSFIYEWSDEIWRPNETGDHRDGQFGIAGKQASQMLVTEQGLFRKSSMGQDNAKLIRVAQRASESGDFALALASTERILNLDSSYPGQKRNSEEDQDAKGAACYIRGSVLLRTGYPEQAREMFKRAAKEYPLAFIDFGSGESKLVLGLIRKHFPACLPRADLWRLSFWTIALGLAVPGVLRLALLCPRRLELRLARSGRTPRIASSVELRRLLTGWRDSAQIQSLAVLAAALLVTFFSWWFHPSRLPQDSINNVVFWSLTVVGVSMISFYWYLWHVSAAASVPSFMEAPSGLRVAMVTTFAAGEPAAMIKKTLRAMREVEYPHDSYVLDETNNRELEEFCKETGCLYFSRQGLSNYNQPVGKFQTRTKGGNINAWLDHTDGRYEFVTFLDPDHEPLPQYLDRVLGYFRASSVAFVQAPQIYKNQEASWIARAAAERSFFFYGPLQKGLFGMGTPILIGCHNTIRVDSLRDIQGYQVHDGDDILTSLHLHAKGWHGVYVPEVLASGLAPDNWTAFLRQQFRWARSVMNITHYHLPPLLRQLRMEHLAAYAGLYFYQASALGFGILLSIPLILAMSESHLTGASAGELAVYFPLLLFAFGLLIWGPMECFLIQPRRERGLWLRGGMAWIASWPYLIMAFLFSVLPARPRARETTPKEQSGNGAQIVAFIPHLGYALALAGIIFYETGGDCRELSVSMRCIVALAIGAQLVLVLTSLRGLSDFRMLAKSAKRFVFPDRVTSLSNFPR